MVKVPIMERFYPIIVFHNRKLKKTKTVVLQISK